MAVPLKAEAFAVNDGIIHRLNVRTSEGLNVEEKDPHSQEWLCHLDARPSP
jgi:hypothetical protein